MARKDNDSSCALIAVAILTFLAAMVFVGMVALPVFLLLCGLYYDRKFKKWKGMLSGTMNDFWLDAEEKVWFKKLKRGANALSAQNDSLLQKGADAGLSRNKDGAFSARSNLGKQIRATLEENTPKLEHALKKINWLSHSPRERWDSFNTVVVRSQAMPSAAAIWMFSYMGYCWLALDFSFGDMGKYYFATITNIFADIESKIVIPPGYTMALLVACGITVLGYALFAFSLDYNKVGAKYSPVPPEVTMQNLNEFGRSEATKVQDRNNDKTSSTAVVAPKQLTAKPSGSSDESSSQARKLVLNMMALAKDIDADLRSKGVELPEPLEERVRGDLCIFALYLCASDGAMSPAEERFLDNCLNMNYDDHSERDGFIRNVHENKDVGAGWGRAKGGLSRETVRWPVRAFLC